MFKLVSVLLAVSALPSPSSGDKSDRLATSLTTYPYLALVEVKTGASPYYANGVLASLQWVLTASSKLAQEPTGQPRNDSFIVYAGLSSLDRISFAPSRKVNKIVTDLMGAENNQYFPNLVLLRLQSEFPKSATARSAVINIGMLSASSLMVGWVKDINTGNILSHPVQVAVKSLSSEQCSVYNLVEFKEQFCALSGEKEDVFHFLEGAMLVDQSRYVTGLMQFNSYYKPQPKNLPIMLMVRLSYFQTFWRFYVHSAAEIFLNTDFNDDKRMEPWEKKMAPADASRAYSSWSWILYTTILVILIVLDKYNRLQF